MNDINSQDKAAAMKANTQTVKNQRKASFVAGGISYSLLNFYRNVDVQKEIVS